MRRRLSVLRGEGLSLQHADPPLSQQSIFEQSALSVEHPLLTYGHALLGAGNPASIKQAVEYGQRAIEQFERVRDTPGLIAGLIMRARALCASGDLRQGMNLMSRAVSLATPCRIAWPFIEHASVLSPLLSQLTTTSLDERSFRDDLLQQHAGQEARLGSPASSEDLPPVHLTWREVEVLGLVAQQFTNKEVAAELVISPETAKRHVTNICRKLAVRSRRAAIRRGRQLGLLR